MRTFFIIIGLAGLAIYIASTPGAAAGIGGDVGAVVRALFDFITAVFAD